MVWVTCTNPVMDTGTDLCGLLQLPCVQYLAFFLAFDVILLCLKLHNTPGRKFTTFTIVKIIVASFLTHTVDCNVK